MASSIADFHATLESTLITFLNNYRTALDTKDITKLSATLSPDCTRHLKPANFPDAYPFIKAVETNAEYEARMTKELGLMEETDVTIQEIVIDPIKRKGSAHALHRNKLVNQEPGSIELCWYVDFTEDGKKISRIVEFIDTAFSEKMIEDMKKRGFASKDH